LQVRLSKIISGGQTGADEAALMISKKSGIKTGGFIPKGFRTEAGNKPSLKKFGLTEISSRSYSVRTKLNIDNSSGTVIFTKTGKRGAIKGKGTKLTFDYSLEKKKPVIINPTAGELKKFIRKNKIKILNIAGDRNSVNPEIGRTVRKILKEFFAE
jgi:hypothetical protein